jgi:hypothetical protein
MICDQVSAFSRDLWFRKSPFWTFVKDIAPQGSNAPFLYIKDKLGQTQTQDRPRIVGDVV